MSGLASTILTGDAAYLVAVQADLLTSSNGRDIYRLKTPDLRIGVYDGPSRKLVIFDGPALVAMTMAEVTDEAPEPPGRLHVIKNLDTRPEWPVVIDPPSRL
jgi:hypothetical protein